MTIDGCGFVRYTYIVLGRTFSKYGFDYFDLTLAVLRVIIHVPIEFSELGAHSSCATDPS
jgi:hypothetical protein